MLYIQPVYDEVFHTMKCVYMIHHARIIYHIPRDCYVVDNISSIDLLLTLARIKDSVFIQRLSPYINFI